MVWLSRATRDAEFSEFAEEATAALTRTAWFLTGDPHAAEELVQAALVKTYVAWPKVRRGEALAYCRRVLVNHNTDAEPPADLHPDPHRRLQLERRGAVAGVDDPRRAS